MSEIAKLRLEGKVAIITGAASGIGEAAARLFASHGALIVIADVQDDLGRSVAASIGADKCSYYHCDVRDEKQIEATVEYTINTYNRFDILYCNAGILGTAHSILDASMEEWDEMFAVNVRGVAAAIKHAGRAMVARGTRGSIVCTASLAAFRGGHGVASYTAAKHAVLGLVRAAAGELGVHGIRVNCVSPSAVATPLGCKLNGWSQSKLEEYGSAVASLKGVVLKANDIAEAALFLAADEAAFITGHNLVVDGGRTVVSARIQQYYDE